MTVESFLNGKVTLVPGDCLDVLRRLGDNTMDACVCDPPYHLTSIVKRFSSDTAAPAKSNGATGVYARSAAGFMGKKWDGGDIAFRVELWREVLRVLKPGAHVVAFSGTRTYHRMVCAIEDAGFEIRDQIGWAFGQGFPKSHDVSKGIDKAAGAERARYERAAFGGTFSDDNGTTYGTAISDIPATDAARAWQGWGTALKPAWEPIVLARKPLSEGTVAANVLRWRTGALNIDACRVPVPDGDQLVSFERAPGNVSRENWRKGTCVGTGKPVDHGRWPANIIHDGSDEVVEAFPDAPGQQRFVGPEHGERPSRGIYGDFGARPPNEPRGDSGSAARFFYSAKADADDRLGSKHPTVKPVDLIQYLVRLVTPLGGTVLDMFAGTGTTGEAAWREGMRAVLIEREAEYQDDIRRRMRLALAGPDERAREAIKAKIKDRLVDAGPLFGGVA